MNRTYRGFHHLRYQFHLRRIFEKPDALQAQLLKNLLGTAKHTEWGRTHDFRQIRAYEDFADRVPITDYDDLKPYINRMMHGETDVLWPGRVQWFSKSSGTTSDKSKYIPVSDVNLEQNHKRGSWDAMTLYYRANPKANQFRYKSMIMGGSLSSFEPYPKSKVGDVSAIMISQLPPVLHPVFCPDIDTALLPDWEEKLDRLARAAIREPNIVMIGGVPTWTVVLFRRILELTGKDHMLEVWPKFQVYTHGGVSFTPYRTQFQEFFPGEVVDYMEIYNASEGFFAVQDQLDKEGMLLLLRNGIFFEFIPVEEWGSPSPKAVQLKDVELGKSYALVISTNGGLWRYCPGDTVAFTSLRPYRIRVTGRTKHFVNAFGEEVVVENTDQALAITSQQTGASVREYTVAPVYFEGDARGGHQWLLEFEKAPEDLELFGELLDKNLQLLNSDYEAKRYGNLALEPLRLQVLPEGTFHDWLRAKGKFGGQHKVPRLANHREYVEEILDFLKARV